MAEDNWRDQSTFCCRTCRFYVPKYADADHPFEIPTPPHIIGRCRRRAPTMDGWPVVFPTDWCGDHKLKAMPYPPAEVSDPIQPDEIPDPKPIIVG